MRRVSFLCVLILCFLYRSSVLAEGDGTEDLSFERKVAEMYQQVFSPFCPGRSLNDCPSSKAQELKTEMVTKLKAGTPAPQILEEVFSRFGDQYRAIPKNEGFGRLVWLVPGLFVVIGGAIAWGLSIRGSNASALRNQAAKGLTPDLEHELQRELERID